MSGTNSIDLRMMKDWVDLGAIQWFWRRDPWIGIQRLNYWATEWWMISHYKWSPFQFTFSSFFSWLNLNFFHFSIKQVLWITAFQEPWFHESAKSHGLRGNVGAWVAWSHGCVSQIFTWVNIFFTWDAWVKYNFAWVKFFCVGLNFFCVGLCVVQIYLRGSKTFALLNFYLVDEIILLYCN